MAKRSQRIVLSDRANTVCDVCTIADRALPRMKGLLGRRSLPPGEGILITPAPSIHTWFMRFPIDVVFLGRDLEVTTKEDHIDREAHEPCVYGGRGGDENSLARRQAAAAQEPFHARKRAVRDGADVADGVGSVAQDDALGPLGHRRPLSAQTFPQTTTRRYRSQLDLGGALNR